MNKTTDKQIEALKLALEALKKCDSALAEELAAWDIDPPLHHVQEASNACGPVITAIREALAEQPVQQEPFCYHDGHDIVGKEFADHSDVFPLYTSPQPAQQQEPVAWRTKNATPPGGYVVFQQYPQALADLGVEIEPLYTSPASKPWIGLTDDDIQEVRENCGVTHHAIKTIEDKLREKNA